MSQAIRKYQTGGKSSQEPELFEWKDVNKYNKSDLVSGLYRNIDTYIQNNGLKGDKADQFRKAAGQFIEGLKSGTVTMNGDGFETYIEEGQDVKQGDKLVKMDLKKVQEAGHSTQTLIIVNEVGQGSKVIVDANSKTPIIIKKA